MIFFRGCDVTFRCSFMALVVNAMVVTTIAHAHDQLKVFASRSTLPASGGKSTIFLCEGHSVPVDELLKGESIARYDLFSPGGTKSALQTSGVSIQANVVEFKEPGVHTVVASRRPSVWTWVFDEKGERKFMRGSKLDHRGEKIETSTRYSEFAKTLVVVGKPDESALKPVGLAVEIIPVDGPAKWLANNDIRFQVLEDGKPVPSVPVVARSLGFKPDDAWNYATDSNRNGEFAIRPDRTGTWIVAIDYRKLMLDDTRKEYDFAWFSTTLTFEVLP